MFHTKATNSTSPSKRPLSRRPPSNVLANKILVTTRQNQVNTPIYTDSDISRVGSHVLICHTM